jgi:Protein of unknown function (DUF4054)
VDLPTFFARYPEFVPAGGALANACLLEAAATIDQATYGNLYDTAQGALAAHLLAISPAGQMARLVAKDGSTTYRKRFLELQRAATCGGNVAALQAFWPGSSFVPW